MKKGIIFIIIILIFTVLAGCTPNDMPVNIEYACNEFNVISVNGEEYGCITNKGVTEFKAKNKSILKINGTATIDYYDGCIYVTADYYDKDETEIIEYNIKTDVKRVVLSKNIQTQNNSSAVQIHKGKIYFLDGSDLYSFDLANGSSIKIKSKVLSFCVSDNVIYACMENDKYDDKSIVPDIIREDIHYLCSINLDDYTENIICENTLAYHIQQNGTNIYYMDLPLFGKVWRTNENGKKEIILEESVYSFDVYQNDIYFSADYDQDHDAVMKIDNEGKRSVVFKEKGVILNPVIYDNVVYYASENHIIKRRLGGFISRKVF